MSKDPQIVEYAKYKQIEELVMSFMCPLSHDEVQPVYIENPLITAIIEKDDEAFNRALVDKENIEKLSKINYTPLHVAASDGREKYVKSLVANQANINAQIPTGATPLHIAVSIENKEIVQYLLEAGAETSHTCCNLTALDMAKHLENSELVTLLELYNVNDSLNSIPLSGSEGSINNDT